MQSQVRVPVMYKNQALREPMRLDLLVDQKVVVEVKATEKAQYTTKIEKSSLNR